MATAQRPVTGPNDHFMGNGRLEPGLGEVEETKVRQLRGMGVVLDEPPAKAELRKQAAELSAKARQLTSIERELEAERTKLLQEFKDREDALTLREAQLDASLKALEGGGK